MMNTKIAELSARHKLTLDCISKLIQSATFYPSRNWDDLYRRTERLRDLLNIAYDEAEELTIYALAETKPEPPKENAPEPTAIGTSAEKKEIHTKHTPKKKTSSSNPDLKMVVAGMLKDGMSVKAISEKTGANISKIYKIKNEVM